MSIKADFSADFEDMSPVSIKMSFRLIRSLCWNSTIGGICLVQGVSDMRQCVLFMMSQDGVS